MKMSEKFLIDAAKEEDGVIFSIGTPEDVLAEMSEFRQYRNRPVTIEAMQWLGNNHSTAELFCPDLGYADEDHLLPVIHTSEGVHSVSIGDYIIKGVKGEFYPCKSDIFAMTYEPLSPVPEKGPSEARHL